MTRRRLLLHLWLQTALWVAIAMVGNHLGAALSARIDVTRDQRFTLSQPAHRAVARLERPLLARVWFTEDLEPPYHNHGRALLDLLDALKAASDGRIEVRITDPTGDAAAIEEARQHGIRPVTYTRQDWDRQEARQVFMGVSFVYGERQQAIDALLAIDRMEYDLVRAIRSVTTAPGERKTVAWLQGNGEPDLSTFAAGNPMAELRDQLARAHHLIPLSLDADPVPEAVDALLVVGPQFGVSARARLHIDQFLMRGGAVGWFLAGVQPDFQAMQLRDVRHDLHGMLGHYGVQLQRGVILDRARNETMLVPVDTDGGRIHARVSYPLAPITTRIDRVHGPVRDLKRAVIPFSTVLSTRDDLTDVEAFTWIESGAGSVAVPSLATLEPSVLARPLADEQPGPFPVAVALTGTFRSAFAGVPVPPPIGRPDAPEPELLLQSRPTRMLVASSADIVANNVPFVLNVTDWLLEDGSLAAIRSRQVGEAPMSPPAAASAWRWRLAIGGPPLVVLWLIGLTVAWRSGRSR